MKYLIILILYAGCTYTEVGELWGEWSNGKGVEISFDGDSFELSGNGEVVSLNGVYEIAGDSIALRYNDKNVAWKENEQRLYFERVNDCQIIIINDIYNMGGI